MIVGVIQLRKLSLWSLTSTLCFLTALLCAASVPKGGDPGKHDKSKVAQPTRWNWAPGDLAISPDGLWLAADLHKDVGRLHSWSVIWLFNLENGETQLISPGLDNEGGGHELTYTPDSKSLAFVSWARRPCGALNRPLLSVRLWDVSTRKEESDDCKPLGSIWASDSIAFSPDGNFFAALGPTAGIPLPLLWDPHDLLRVWDRQTGAPLKLSTSFHGFFHYGLAFSPDSSQLAVGHNKQITLLDLREAKEVFRYECGVYCFSPQFSSDGKLLAAVDRLGRIHLWDVDTGNEHALQQVHTVSPYSFVFRFVSNTQIAVGEDTAIGFWDVKTGREAGSVPFPHGAPYPFIVTPDGQAVIGGGPEVAPVIHMWNATTGEEIRQWDLTKIVNEGASSRRVR